MPEAPTSPGPPDRPFEGPTDGEAPDGVQELDASAEIKEAVGRVFAPHWKRQDAHGDPGRRARNLWLTWRGILRTLLPLGAVSRGNRVRVMADGDRVFHSMWRAIEDARWEILMTTYTLSPDSVGRRTLQLLSQAARRGCRVTLVFDAIGSHELESDDLFELRESGARVHAFNPIWRWSKPLSRWVRNHQKILVVDNELGFAGGMNVGRDYAGSELGNARFRDTHLELRGPSVPELARMVIEALADEGVPLAARPHEFEAPSPPAPDEPHDCGDGCLVQILESNVRRHQRAIQLALRTTVRRSVERCYLCSPYFVPPPRLSWALKRAARRGIDVRILTAGVSDVPLVRMASAHLYGDLLRAGVRIFELQSATLHAKTMTVDGVYAAVGSFNLDYWSDRRNLEVNVSFLDSEMASLIEKQFNQDLKGSKEVKLPEWKRRSPWRRFVDTLAYLLLSV